MTRTPRPDFLVVGAPKAGTTALHAALAQHPDVFMSRAQGAEVLAVRRRPAAGLVRPRGRALPAGVDLARRRLLPALRAGRRRPGARREHAVLPVEPRRPPPDRRGAARRAARSPWSATRSTGPTATGCTCGPTASSPSPTSRPRSPARTSGCGRAGRRSGATATSGGTASSSTHLLRLRRPRAGPRHALPRPRRRAPRDRRPGLPVPRHPRGAGRRDPAGQLAQLRAARLAAPGARAGRARRRPARAVRPAAGLARGSSPPLDPPAERRPRRHPPAARRRRSGERLAGAVRRRHRPADPAHRQDFSDWLSPESRGSYDERRRDGHVRVSARR